MENIYSFISKKQEKNIAPKYGMRKLSIGFVSCFLGCAIFMVPVGVHAESEAVDAPAAVVAEAPNFESAEPVVEKETSVVGEHISETPVEEAINEEKETVLVEEAAKDEQAGEKGTPVEDKAAVEEKAAPDKVDATEEKAIAAEVNKKEEVSANAKEMANKDENLADKATDDGIVKENFVAMDASDQVATEEVAAEKREPKDISNEITNQYVAITEEGHQTPGTVKPDDGEAIGWEVSFTTPKGTTAGDYFTIDLSENLSLKGIEPDHENEYPIEINDKVVADGIRLDRSTIKYTFNENVNDERNVRVSVKGFAYVDKTKVQNTTDEKFSIAVGDTTDEKILKVEYEDTYFTGNHLNGVSQFTEFNPKTGEYTQVFYINPESKTITTSNRNWATGKVAMFIDGLTPDGSPSDVNYTEENTKVSIQKLPAGMDVPSAIIENPVQTDEETIVKTTFRNGGIEITFADNGDQKLRHNNIDSPYIVTVKSTAAPSQTGSNVYSRATLYGDGTRFHIMDNSIVTTEGDTDAQGERVGYFKEHHVYYTKVDGILQEDQTFTIHSSKTEGFDYDNYFTSKNEIDDFIFVKVDTDRLVENPAYNADGTLAHGGYEVGKTKEVTYIYERDIKHGSFQEHHIYQSLDEDGNIVAEETVTKEGKETTGFDETTYETSKKDQAGNIVTEETDKDGYKLISVEASGNSVKKEEVKFNSEGAATTGNYVNGEKLEVTYTYQKKVTTKGSFVEHHIYQTVDEDGKVISTDDKLKKDSESTGKETEEFTTSKKDEEGYTLVKVEGTEGTNFKQDGSAQKTNYKKGETQEVTYTYQKKVKKPVTPTPDKPKKPEEPTKPGNPTPITPDEPTGWTPVVPAEPKTPETPVKDEPKDPAPQTPEKPVQPKPADQKVEKPVEPKAEEKETLTTDAPVKTKEEVDQPKVHNGDGSEERAPQTYDAGVASYAGLAGIASGVLAYLESKKRKNK